VVIIGVVIVVVGRRGRGRGSSVVVMIERNGTILDVVDAEEDD
jgi:hypothetical protein